MNPDNALAEFLKHCKRRRLADNTLINYSYIFKRFVHTNHLTDLDTLSDVHIETYLDAYSHLSARTVHKQLSLLRTLFNWLENRGLIHSNPFRHYELPRFTKRLREVIPVPDLERLLDYIPGDPIGRACNEYSGYRDNLIWHFCALSGMRISEVLNLKMEDLRPNGIYVRKAKMNKSRIIPMLPRLQCAVNRYMPYLHYQLGRAPTEDDFLFPGATNDKRLTTPYIWGRFKKALGHLDMRRYSFHNLRHTYATLLVRAKVDPFTLIRLTGHSTVNAALDYIHIDDVEAREAAMRHPLAQLPTPPTDGVGGDGI